MPREQSLVVESAQQELLQYQVYKKSQANIDRLKDRLPADVVINLAREVIRRVALKDRKLQSDAAVPCPEDLEKLCYELLSDDDKSAVEMIAGLRADGVEAEDIYLKHLSGAARMLGRWWEEDKVNFSQVTVASSRMFAIMRSMRHLFEPATPTHSQAAIFASVPGEDHTMGVRMAADLFRKEGWDILLKVGLDHEALVAEIEQEPTGIVGLSISGQHSVDALTRLVVALRISCPQVYLLVSGQDIKETKPVLSLMGFDGIAGDIEEAKEKMAALWQRKLLEKRVHQSVL